MPLIDKKKAELDDLKTWRNYAVTSFLALMAFIFTKMTESDALILALSAFAIVVLGIAIVILQIKIKKLIKEIGEL